MEDSLERQEKKSMCYELVIKDNQVIAHGLLLLPLWCRRNGTISVEMNSHSNLLLEKF